MSITKETCIFALSSLVTIAVSYAKVPLDTLLKIDAVFLLLFLFLLNRTFFSAKQPIPTDSSRLTILFLSSLIVNLLVFSTGGLYSPFLILYHLYVLSSCFLLSLSTSLSYLILSLLTVSISVLIEPHGLKIFSDDPWSAFLYLISFLVIIPLAEFLINTYRLKDSLSKMLSLELRSKEKEVELESKRRQTLLESLDDLTLITDRDGKILSINDATRKALGVTSNDILNQDILSTLILRDSAGNSLTRESLQIGNVLEQKRSVLLENITLYAKNNIQPAKVILKITPIQNLEGSVDQISFLISDPYKKQGSGTTNVTEHASVRQDALFDELGKKLVSLGQNELVFSTHILKNTEKDILYATQLGSGDIQQTTSLRNIAQITSQIIDATQEFAQSLTSSLTFTTLSEGSDDTLKPKNYRSLSSSLFLPYYVVPINPQWFEILITKLVHIALLLTSSTDHREVVVSSSYDNNVIVIRIVCQYRELSDHEKSALLKPYYDQQFLDSNLMLGSGLEGYIVAKISEILFISLGIETNSESGQLVFSIQLLRGLKN